MDQDDKFNPFIFVKSQVIYKLSNPATFILQLFKIFPNKGFCRQAQVTDLYLGVETCPSPEHPGLPDVPLAGPGRRLSSQAAADPDNHIFIILYCKPLNVCWHFYFANFANDLKLLAPAQQNLGFISKLHFQKFILDLY